MIHSLNPVPPIHSYKPSFLSHPQISNSTSNNNKNLSTKTAQSKSVSPPIRQRIRRPQPINQKTKENREGKSARSIGEDEEPRYSRHHQDHWTDEEHREQGEHDNRDDAAYGHTEEEDPSGDGSYYEHRDNEDCDDDGEENGDSGDHGEVVHCCCVV